ncbi:MAG TPA: hypothetical protein VMY38_02435 [Gemmatimonadaceae bacterium]|nr:hypothetical protein [Gemmatimonadaceae bacterium]
MKRSVFLAAPALALASLVLACVTPRPETRVANRCNIMLPGTLGIAMFSMTESELTPGQSARMATPMMYTVPHEAPYPLPANCTVRWSVGSGATITADGELTIAPDAAPGSIVVVRAHVDTLMAAKRFLVVDPAPNALAGQWTQVGPTLCANGQSASGDIVRELEFRRSRTFSVTRVPFESYRDYWGTYTFDAAAARLTLTVSGSNSAPGFTTAELAARVVDGRLSLDGALLSPSQSGAPGQSCRSVFRRPGDAR